MSNPSGYIKDILDNSVTRAEVDYQKPINGWPRVLVGYSIGGISIVLKSLPDLPPFWSIERDHILQSTIMESHWAEAVGISVMKLSSRSWDIDGNVPFVRKERARTIVRGWDYIGQVQKGFIDYIMRDNGWWIEIVRQSSAAGSRVLGLNYLSSARCYPTGNPEIPCVYWDRLGRYHELRAHQVIRFVDTPDGNNPLGVGMCAARRAYNDIRNFAAIQRYRLEKMTGARPLSLYFVTGVTNEQIKTALMDAREKREAEGVVSYGGAVISAFIQREGINKVEIPLASLPDQFDYKNEVSETDFAYANALPLVISLDLRPMTGQRAGSGSQSQVIDDHAIVKEAVLRDITQKFNNQDVWHILPEGTSFYFVRNDLVDRKREADIVNTYVTAASTAVAQMGLDPNRAVDWLSDKDIFPTQWGQLTPDAMTGVLSDSENINPNGEKLPSVISGPAETPAQLGAKPTPDRSGSNAEPPMKAEQKEFSFPNLSITNPPITINFPPMPDVNIHNNIPVPSVSIAPAQVNVESPNVSVTNQVNPTPVSQTINLPETQIHVQSASPDIRVEASAPIVNNIIPQSAETTTELSFIRGEDNLIQSPITKTVKRN